MGQMKRLRNRLQMTPPKPPAWVGEPNERELELDRKLEALDAKHKAVGLTEAEKLEGVRLNLDLLEESQKRSGVTLFKITRNAADDGAIYDASNFFRMTKDVQMLMAAGMPKANAIARALEDERYRQQQEAAEAGAERGGGLIGAIKNIFNLKRQ